jgi:sodium pump decarboxylase gamma subunit
MAVLMQDGLNITGIGMGVVFTLLTLLVFIIRGMSALCQALQPAGPSPAGTAAPGTTGAPTADHELVIAISAAIAAHRKRH